MLTTLMSRIRGVRSAAALTYRELVQDTAQNADCRLTDDELEKTLASAGKSLEQFAADVGRLVDRAQAARDLAEADALQAEAAAADQAATDARREYFALVEEHKRLQAAARQKWTDTASEADRQRHNLLSLRERAQQVLRQTAPTSIDAEIARIDAQIESLRDEQRRPYTPPIVNPPLAAPIRMGILDADTNPTDPSQDPEKGRPWLSSRSAAMDDPAKSVHEQLADAHADRAQHLQSIGSEIAALQERKAGLEASKLEV